MKNYIIIVFFSLLSLAIFAQTEDSTKTKIREGEYYGTTVIDGTVIPILIIDGDTLPTINAPDVTISRIQNFKSREERRRYYQWRRYAAKVYPYALEAIRLYRQVEAETSDMKKRKRKKYTKKIEKNLKPKYEDELKSLTKSQGYILIKMVERELEKPFYNVISTIRGGWEAIKWNSMASFYGYNLKKGYNIKDDEILEFILNELNISYDYDNFLKK